MKLVDITKKNTYGKIKDPKTVLETSNVNTSKECHESKNVR